MLEHDSDTARVEEEYFIKSESGSKNWSKKERTAKDATHHERKTVYLPQPVSPETTTTRLFEIVFTM